MADIARNMASGTVVAILAFAYSLSFSLLLFSGSLVGSAPRGMAIMLMSTGLSTLIISATSSFRLAVAGPDTATIAVLAAMVVGISSTAAGTASSAQLELLVFIVLSGTTVFVGAMLLLFGVLRLGMWIRYVPFPVIAGFLTASGVLLILGAIRLLIGGDLSLVNLPDSMRANVALPLVLAGGLALVMALARTRWVHPMLLPIMLLCAVVLIDGTLWAFGLSLDDARALGLIKLPAGTMDLGLPWLDLQKTSLDAAIVLDVASEVVIATAVTAIAVLLNVTGLEVAHHTPGNLDRELRFNGIANLVNGACGGLVTNISLNRTEANRASGATSRLSGMVAGVLCLAGIAIGPRALQWVPTPVVAGLLLYLGGWLILEWLVRPWHRLSAMDNALVIAIPVLVVQFGYLEAAGFGVVASCIIFVVKYSRLRVIKHDLTRREYSSRLERSPDHSAFLKQNGDLIHIMWIQGYLFFGSANRLLEGGSSRISDSEGRSIRFLILDLSDVTGVDSSCVLSFTKLAGRAQSREVILILTGIRDTVRKSLAGTKFLTSHSNVFEFAQVDRALEWAEERLLGAADLNAPPQPSFDSWLDQQLRRDGSAERLMRYLEIIDLNPGDLLFGRGDAADSLYLVGSGRVSVMLYRPRAEPIRLRSTMAYTVVGEMGLYRAQARTAAVVADERSRVYRLSKAALDDMEREDPILCAAFHAFVVRIVADRLSLATLETDALQR